MIDSSVKSPGEFEYDYQNCLRHQKTQVWPENSKWGSPHIVTSHKSVRNKKVSNWNTSGNDRFGFPKVFHARICSLHNCFNWKLFCCGRFRRERALAAWRTTQPNSTKLPLTTVHWFLARRSWVFSFKRGCCEEPNGTTGIPLNRGCHFVGLFLSNPVTKFSKLFFEKKGKTWWTRYPSLNFIGTFMTKLFKKALVWRASMIKVRFFTNQFPMQATFKVKLIQSCRVYRALKLCLVSSKSEGPLKSYHCTNLLIGSKSGRKIDFFAITRQ